jgi:plasmid maintenance system antidote protein VapI
MSDRFWSTLQANYDLELARDALGPRLEKEVTPRAA